MDEKLRSQIRDFKTRTMAMLKIQRKSNKEISDTYWSRHSTILEYMLDLPEERFAQIRYHTWAITADCLISYEEFVDSADFLEVYDQRVDLRDIPQKYILNEPEGGIGFQYEDGRFLNHDIIRYQRAINNLVRYGVFKTLDKLSPRRRLTLFEVGGGYGAIAHHLSRIIGDSTYVIVDLPETLFMAASYLALNNPDKSIYLYSPQDFGLVRNRIASARYDFILIPNWVFQDLGHWEFDLALNMHSFQEMRSEDVEEYLDFIQRTCSGIFFSENRDSEPNNFGMSSVADLIGSRFHMEEILDPKSETSTKVQIVRGIRKAAGLVGRGLGLLDTPSKSYPTREFICYPKGLGEEANKV